MFDVYLSDKRDLLVVRKGFTAINRTGTDRIISLKVANAWGDLWFTRQG